MNTMKMQTLCKKFILATVVTPLLAAFALTAQAAPVAIGPISITTIPAGWVEVDAPKADEDGIYTAMFGKEDHSAVVNLLAGKNIDKESAKQLAQSLAESMNVTESVKEKGGQYTFSFERNGVKGMATIACDQDMFAAVIVQGNFAAGQEFLKGMRCDKYPGLCVK